VNRAKHGCPKSRKHEVAFGGDNPEKQHDAQAEQVRSLAVRAAPAVCHREQ